MRRAAVPQNAARSARSRGVGDLGEECSGSAAGGRAAPEKQLHAGGGMAAAGYNGVAAG